MPKPKKRIPAGKLIGVILILAGIAVILVPNLSPASILLGTPEITASTNQLISIRYGYLNEGKAQSEYLTTITRDSIVMGTEKFTLQPATIFSGIIDFYTPSEKGTYYYKINVYSLTTATKEEKAFKVVVT